MKLLILRVDLLYAESYHRGHAFSDETLHPLDMVESRVQQQHPVQPQAQAPPEADNHTKAATHPGEL